MPGLLGALNKTAAITRSQPRTPPVTPSGRKEWSLHTPYLKAGQGERGLPAAATHTAVPRPSSLCLRTQSLCGVHSRAAARLTPVSGPAHLPLACPIWQPRHAWWEGSKPASSGAPLLALPPWETEPKKTGALCLFSELQPGAVPVRQPGLKAARVWASPLSRALAGSGAACVPGAPQQAMACA